MTEWTKGIKTERKMKNTSDEKNIVIDILNK